MAFTQAWNELVPDGSVIKVSELDDYQRNTKVAIRERLEGDPADDLTGVVDNFGTASTPKVGSARLHADTEANVGAKTNQDGRGLFTTDAGDAHPKVFHLAGAGDREIAYLNRDGSRPMVGPIDMGSNSIRNSAKPRCRNRRAGTKDTAITTDVAVDFPDADDYDVGAVHNPATNNTRFTIPANEGGLYQIAGASRWPDGTGSGIKRMKIRKNGTTILHTIGSNYASAVDQTFREINWQDEGVPGDYYELIIYSDLIITVSQLKFAIAKVS